MCCGVTMPTMPSSVTARRSSAVAASGSIRGSVATELGARVVERAAERDREAALEPRPLLARAAGEHDGHVDAFEVHVLEAAAGIGHAGPREAVDARRAARLLDADPRQVRELALDAFAPGRHVRLELARQAFLPVSG